MHPHHLKSQIFMKERQKGLTSPPPPKKKKKEERKNIYVKKELMLCYPHLENSIY